MAQSAINQFQPSLFSTSPQLTVAFANFNFDFTLHKNQAPSEYIGLGSALSKRRRHAAEDGSEHIIARKLGALFQRFLPHTPTLIKAYGERASAIVTSDIGYLRNNCADGVFADFAGVDGTSIWAAATSSEEAISVHLLACMLARIWSAPEATAIWAELVEERQAELMKLTPDDPLHLSDLAAARLELTRDELAAWDASARSWLSIADDVMKREQTRLLLLVDKTKLPVDVTPGVYKSVTIAWKSSLETINKILEGMSYEVHDGAVILGLASWHLYPDMHVLVRGTTKDIEQQDPIIPQAGLLTFGIEGRSPDEDDGIRWSLPLARLRYYGDPVNSKKHMGTSSMRLTLVEFQLVLLGSIFASWGRYSQDVTAAADLIRTMWEFICSASRMYENGPLVGSDISSADYHDVKVIPKMNTWFRMLYSAADDLLSSDEVQRQARERLVERGCRRYETFLAPWSRLPKPVFGLCKIKDLTAILHEEGRIQFLRRVAAGTGLKPSDLIIRYHHRRPVSEGKRKTISKFKNDLPSSKVFLPNAAPEDAETLMGGGYSRMNEGLHQHHSQGWQHSSQTTANKASHELRSLSSSPNLEDSPSEVSDAFEPAISTGDSVSVSPAKRVGFSDHTKQKPRKRRRTRNSDDPLNEETLFDEDFEYAAVTVLGPLKHRWLGDGDDFNARATALAVTGEQCDRLSSVRIVNFSQTEFIWITISNYVENDFTYELDPGVSSDVAGDTYKYLLGDPNVGAIFQRTYGLEIPTPFYFNSTTAPDDGKNVFESQNINHSTAQLDGDDDLDLVEVKHAFESQAVDPIKLLDRLSILGANEDTRSFTEAPVFVRSLRAIAGAATAYKLMPGSTVTTSVFKNPVHEALWNPGIFDQTSSIVPEKATHGSKTDSDDCEDSVALNFRRHRDVGRITARGNNRLSWLQAYNLDRPSMFACIAMFENGDLNIGPTALERVLALSAANSIYVSMPLTCDPSDAPLGYEMKRIIGNIGHPGISFLVPPPNPKVKKVEEDSWTIVNHSAFDGKFEDSFHATTMHLSFTKLKIPIGLSTHSGQDVEACFRQAIVSLRSGGKWFADLDILGAFDSPLFIRPPYGKSCIHSQDRRSSPNFMLKSIDNWDEFLDRPKVPGIVRARGNWQGRLAATALNIQQGFPTIVLDSKEHVCWACALVVYQKAKLGEQSSSNAYRAADVPFFIS